MRRSSSVFHSPSVLAFPFILIAALVCIQTPRAAEGAMITYISATRYIQGNGIPREDAVGLSDFDVSRGAFVGVPNAGVMYARVEAAQTSRLLIDRIEVSASTLTQFIQNPFGNSIAATSSVSITFELDEVTQVTLTTGPIFSQSNGGGAGIVLRFADGAQDFILGDSGTGDPVSATLQPGRYILSGGAFSGSLQSVAGAAQMVATLTVPPVSALGTMAAGASLAGLRRARRD